MTRVVCLRVGVYLQRGVCLWVGGLPPGDSASRRRVLHRGGGGLHQDTWILRDTVNQWAVRILQKCFLVKTCKRQLQAPTIKIFDLSYLDIEACRTVYVPHSHLNFFLFREFANAKRIWYFGFDVQFTGAILTNVFNEKKIYVPDTKRVADRIKCSAMTAGCEFNAIHPRSVGSLAFPTAMTLYGLFRQKLNCLIRQNLCGTGTDTMQKYRSHLSSHISCSVKV